MSNLKNLKPFKKGKDTRRNTKGRPKGTLDIRERVREAVKNKKEMFNGKEIDMEQAIIMKLLMDARNGKYQQTKLVMDYLYGKPVSVCPRCEQRELGELERQNKDYKLEEERKAEKFLANIKKFEDMWFDSPSKEKKRKSKTI